MNKTTAFLLIASALACGRASCDTFSVTPGQSIQDAIDNAADGDLIVIFGGSYGQEITIDKAVQLTEATGEEVIISGNVTITGVTDAPPFRGFNLGAGTTSLTVENTTGLAISDVVMNHLIQKGGSVYVSDSTINGVWYTELYQILNPALNPNFPPNHPANAGIAPYLTFPSERSVGFRVTVNGGCAWHALRQGWLGYSIVGGGGFMSSTSASDDIDDAISVLVGNEIQTSTPHNVASNFSPVPIRVTHAGADSSVQIYNNYLTSSIARPNHIGSSVIPGFSESIRVGANHLRIQNNFSELFIAGNPANVKHPFAVSKGYAAYQLSGNVITVRNNVIKGNVIAINAPVNSVIEYNYADNANHYSLLGANSDVGFPLVGECIPTFAANNDGDLVNTNTGRESGEAGYAFIKDSGWWAYDGDDGDVESLASPDGLYNDRDESRNNAGPSGGPCFDPEAWTTTKPVVISFDINPESQVTGQGAQVILSNGIAISAP